MFEINYFYSIKLFSIIESDVWELQMKISRSQKKMCFIVKTKELQRDYIYRKIYITKSLPKFFRNLQLQHFWNKYW